MKRIYRPLQEDDYGCWVEKLYDPVDGEKVYRKCSVQRQAGKICGPNAVKFEGIIP